MRWAWLVLGVVALALVFAAATLPARVIYDLALAPNGLRADRVHGSIWRASAYGVRVGGQRFEQVEARLRVAPLLRGRAEFAVRAAAPGLTFRGDLIAGFGGSLEARDVTGAVALYRLPALDGVGAPLSERVTFALAQARFTQAGCEAAAGTARTTALAAMGLEYDADLPVIEGRFTCAGPRLGLFFEGESEIVSLSGWVRASMSGYDWTLEAQTNETGVMGVLLQLGLEDQGEGAWRAQGAGRL